MVDETQSVPPRLPGESFQDWMDRINAENDYVPGQPEEPQSEVESRSTRRSFRTSGCRTATTRRQIVDKTKAAFEHWAILELMGHRKLGGRVSEALIAGAPFIRIDVPGAEVDVATQFYAPAAVYCITPCSEDLARRTAAAYKPAPVTEYDLPSRPRLAAQTDSGPTDEPEGASVVFDDEDDEDLDDVEMFNCEATNGSSSDREPDEAGNAGDDTREPEPL